MINTARMQHWFRKRVDEWRLALEIWRSGLFDRRWYRSRYPDVAHARIPALIHFMRYGFHEGRDPSSRFQGTWYFRAYRDVAASGMNPVLHYLRFGRTEGRLPCPPSADGGNDELPSRYSDPYEAWLAVNRWNERAEADLHARLKEARDVLPTISVVMPVYNPDLAFLDKAIESVRGQIFTRWELCIADDASTDPKVRGSLESLSKNSRIRVVFRSGNGGISRATNSAAELATGDYLLLIDQDDELEIDALAEVVLFIAERPETDFLYSDSDKIDAEGRRSDPHFKPDWSPETLLSYMYACQVMVIRRSLFQELGGMRSEYDGSQDHDFALRVAERTDRIGHIPRVLYHWRRHPGSLAQSGAAKPHSLEAGRRAIQDALRRRGIEGIVETPEWALRAGVGIHHIVFPDTGPSVTIVVPTRNRVDLLKRCLASLEKTTYRPYEVLIVDNDSDDPETLDYLQGQQHEVLKVSSDPPGEFNFSRLINRGAARARSGYFLLLNNDTEVVAPRWLSAMMGYARMLDVGAVGALLRFPDGCIQHAGVVCDILDPLHGECCEHAFKQERPFGGHERGMTALTRNCSAVTAACMLTSRSLFLEMGGFDEQGLKVIYNDPDYCLRLAERGCRTVYTPDAELLHHEGASRVGGYRAHEVACFRDRHGHRRDPYYNHNYSRERPLFGLQPRRVVCGKRRPFRVLLFTHNLNLEGAPKVVSQIACYLKAKRIAEPVVYSPTDGPRRKELECQGIQVCMGEPRETLRGYLSARRPHVIFSNTISGWYAIGYAKELNIPAVWTVHESFWAMSQMPWELREHVGRLLSYPYRVVFVCGATREQYRRYDLHGTFTVIPNAIDAVSLDETTMQLMRQDARQSLGIAREECVILNVGTPCERKGQIDAVLAMKMLLQKSSGGGLARLVLLGDRPSPYSQRIHEILRDLPEAVQQRIVVVSEVDDVDRYYAAADIFLLTSRVESAPLVILEAMARGLPILATPVDGVVEQVREGVNADFYFPGDVAVLARKMERLIGDPQRRRRYGDGSCEMLKTLGGFDGMVRSYAEILQEASLAGTFGDQRG